MYIQKHTINLSSIESRRDSILQFEWDEDKNDLNYYKHQVFFEEAKTVWCDLNAVEYYDDDHSDIEDRFLRKGFSLNNRLLIVVFVEYFEPHLIRIISARLANIRERREHEERV